MSAVGTWDVTLATRLGKQEMQLLIFTQTDRFTGRIESPMGRQDIAGEVNGDALRWTVEIRKPIPIKATYDVVVDGATMRGTAKLGFLGKAALTGARASAAAAPPAAGAEDDDAPVTADSIDPQFRDAYVEIDEERTDPAPHRYVHGGFMGTDARFSFYFPQKAQYQGRFFHNTYPLATSADVGPFPIAFDVATGNLAFTFDSGAYYVQTNLGGADRQPPADPAIGAYRVNAAAAKFSRIVAARIYGVHRPYGYLFGGSGGSYQVMGAAENTRGVWDGFVPFVLATPNAIPSMFTVRMHALRVLRARNRLPAIVDAVAPGGSGDPEATLNAEERAALQEATRLGFPPRGWYDHATMTSGYFSKVAGIVPMLDPGYLDDFWSQPGYLGSDPAAAIRAQHFTFDTNVTRVVEGLVRSVELASLPDRDITDAHLVRLDAAADPGQSAAIGEVDGRRVGFSISANPAIVQAFQVGDRVRIDNAWALALQTYHRHQVPTPDLYAWDQFRDAQGEPRFPQRELLIGPLGAAGTAGSVPCGRIEGKMLAVECLMDIDALPWQADWYRHRVQEQLGARFDDQFALWFIDHAQHDNPATPIAHAHTVSFAGALQQALRDVAAWVEQGVRPSSTRYRMEDAQVVVPATAHERGGVQPVVDLQVEGKERAEVGVGTPVTFTATVQLPPNAGQVVAADWDFEGEGVYATAAAIASPGAEVRLTATHRYTKPGTYFPALRAASQRQGDARTPYGRVQNLARVRVVVC
jgi:hypothetical protein